MNQETLETLFIEELRDLYDAEKQLVKALPKIAKAATSEDLVDAVNEHLEQTKEHVTRLESVFELMETPAKSKPCKGMRGLIEEGSEVIEEEDKGTLRDLALIAAAQKCEHYEISAYGTIRTMAEVLNNPKVVELLVETEDEEKAADSKLTEIAEELYRSQDDSEEEENDDEMVSAGNGRGGAKSKKSSGGAKTKARR